MRFKVKIAGDRLLMHNGQLADPLNEYSKELKQASKKKQKSDADHLEVARIEFQGGLYHDDDLGPYIPGDAIQSALIQASKHVKLGKQFSASVIVPDDRIKLLYTGPRDREGLWNDKRFIDRRAVKVQMSKVMRTRPIFRDWSCSFSVEVFDGAVNREDVEAALKRAGMFVGLLEGRPRLGGKFVIEAFEEVEET